MPLSPGFLGARPWPVWRMWRLVAVATVAAGVTTACFPAKDPAPGSHHDDPFLTCVRQRESGGRYHIDSPDGQYHGAYQFLQGRDGQACG